MVALCLIIPCLVWRRIFLSSSLRTPGDARVWDLEPKETTAFLHLGFKLKTQDGEGL